MKKYDEIFQSQVGQVHFHKEDKNERVKREKERERKKNDSSLRVQGCAIRELHLWESAFKVGRCPSKRHTCTAMYSVHICTHTQGFLSFKCMRESV